MAGVNVKMGVTGVSEFKKGMKDAESAVSTLNSALKLNKEELKAAGNQEQYLKNKTDLLKAAIEKQTQVVRNAEAAIKAMRENGVSEASTAFQKMQQKVYDSQTKLAKLNTELKETETGAKGAGDAISGIGKNVSWDNIAEGIGKINSQLMNAGRAAVNFGKKISRSVMSSAEWADQLKTTAEQWDITPERLQRMQNVAEIIDTDVDAILSAQARMAKAATTKSGIKTIEETLGLSLSGQSVDDLFWEIGDALMNMGDSFDKEGAAQKIFGRSWRELIPLFKTGREEYEKLLEDQKVMSDEDVNRLGALDDQIKGLQQQIELLKNQFIADNADKIQGFLQWLVDNADGVKTALIAIGAGFGALKVAEVAANLAKVIEGFKSLGLLKSGGEAAAAAAGGSGALGLLLAGGLAAAPAALAYIAANAIPNENKLGKEERVVNATYTQEEVQRLREWVGLQNELFQIESKYGTTGFNEARYIELHEMLAGMNVQSGDLWSKYWDYLVANDITPGTKELPTDFLDKMIEQATGGATPEIHAEPVLSSDAAAVLQEQLNALTVTAPVNIAFSYGKGHANGLPFVPFDGYPAVLHKGERVVPAREVAASRNFSSNLYVESMYMNNGTDAEGLAAAMASAQRRTMSGYGS